METRSRDSTGAQAAFVRLRDQVCATHYCGAPIMQIDHVEAWTFGGPTSLINAQGLCQACNLAKADTPTGPTPAETQPPPRPRLPPPDIGYPRVAHHLGVYRCHPIRSRAPAGG